jgi:hypothetical protein
MGATGPAGVGATGVTGPTGPQGIPGPSLTGLLFAYSTGTQTASTLNTYQLVTFTQAPIYDIWTPLGPVGAYTGFSLSANSTGTYLVTYSGNVTLNNAGAILTAGYASLNTALNNVEIPGSQAGIEIPEANHNERIGNTFLVTLNPTGVLAFNFAASLAGGPAVGAQLTPVVLPAIPAGTPTSFSASITRVR